MHRIYKCREFVIYQTEYGYIVQNILMDDFAHTHVNSKNDALRLVGLSVNKRIPIRIGHYMLVSLLRINRDKEYCDRVQSRIDRKQWKQ